MIDRASRIFSLLCLTGLVAVGCGHATTVSPDAGSSDPGGTEVITGCGVACDEANPCRGEGVTCLPAAHGGKVCKPATCPACGASGFCVYDKNTCQPTGCAQVICGFLAEVNGCSSCEQSSCCTQSTTCANNPACASLYACAMACTSQSCVTTCEQGVAAAVVSEYHAIGTCLHASCSLACFNTYPNGCPSGYPNACANNICCPSEYPVCGGSCGQNCCAQGPGGTASGGTGSGGTSTGGTTTGGTSAGGSCPAPTSSGACNDPSKLFCGTACCATTNPYYCASNNTCYPDAASAAAACGSGCTACRASSTSAGTTSGGSGGTGTTGSSCHDETACLQVTSNHPTGAGHCAGELTATATNTCGYTIYCELAPSDHASAAGAGNYAAGQTANGEASGNYWCNEATANVVYACELPTDDPSCLPRW